MKMRPVGSLPIEPGKPVTLVPGGNAKALWGGGIAARAACHDAHRQCRPGAGRAICDGAATSAAQAATIILEGVKADRWRILVGADAHKIDEMIRQSPKRAYDLAFFDEFARAAGWTERLSLENPELRPPRWSPTYFHLLRVGEWGRPTRDQLRKSDHAWGGEPLERPVDGKESSSAWPRPKAGPVGAV
jgi:hypothetical protein